LWTHGTELHQSRTINVESRDKISFASISNVWLSLRQSAGNKKKKLGDITEFHRHRSRNMESVSVNSSTPLNKLWVFLWLISRNLQMFVIFL